MPPSSGEEGTGLALVRGHLDPVGHAGLDAHEVRGEWHDRRRFEIQKREARRCFPGPAPSPPTFGAPCFGGVALCPPRASLGRVVGLPRRGGGADSLFRVSK